MRHITRYLVVLALLIVGAWAVPAAHAQCVGNNNTVTCTGFDEDGFRAMGTEDITVTVESGAMVNGIGIDESTGGLTIDITNNGTIYEGIGSFINDGSSVIIDNNAYIATDSGNAILVVGNIGSDHSIMVTNDGSINAVADFAETGMLLRVETGGSIEVVNNGPIEAAIVGLDVGGAFSPLDSISVENNSTITSDNIGVAFGQIETANVSRLTNTGTIIGAVGVGPYLSGYGKLDLINSGTITGTDGTAVDLDYGDNSATMKVGSVVNGTIDGNNGTDTLIFDYTGAPCDTPMPHTPTQGSGSIDFLGNTHTYTSFETVSVTFNVSPCVNNGDIDENGHITPVDAITVLNTLGDPVSETNLRADTDGDNDIDIADFRYVVGRLGATCASEASCVLP